MILICSASQHINKVAAIKALRVLTKCGIKEAKDFVEEAMEKGSVDNDDINVLDNLTNGDKVNSINTLNSLGYFVESKETKMLNALTAALDVATEQRRYATIRALLDIIEGTTPYHSPN